MVSFFFKPDSALGNTGLEVVLSPEESYKQTERTLSWNLKLRVLAGLFSYSTCPALVPSHICPLLVPSLRLLYDGVMP